MAHLHSVYDTDTHFQIDGVTRAVKNASSTKTMLVQYDHNSERFTFEIPRMIDGHDMSTCNAVQVHYINIESANKSNRTAGVYEVGDLQISPDSNDVVICSWLISANATKYVGNLSFVLRFVCSSDGAVDYAWHTAVHSGVSVATGIYNGDAIATEYADILAQWEERIQALEQNGGGSGGGTGGSDGVDGEDGGYYTPTVTQTDENTMKVAFTASKEGMAAVAEKSITLPAGKDGEDGDTPVKGVDYWTESDKQEILDEIGAGISAVPDYVRTEAETVARIINQHQSNDSIVFPFLSDAHCGYYKDPDNDATELAGQLLHLVGKRVPFDFIANGGDMANGAYDTTKEMSFEQIEDYTEFVNDAHRGVPSVWTMGNHDDSPYQATEARVSQKETFALIGRKNRLNGAICPNGCNYGFLDLENRKLRVIYLDTDDKRSWGTITVGSGETGPAYLNAHNVGGVQLQWLSATALDFTDKADPTEWGIVIISHVALNISGSITDAVSGATYDNSTAHAATILNAYKNGKAGSITHNGITANYDFSTLESRATVICCVHGHNHAFCDEMAGSILSIGCPNVMNGREKESADGNTYTKTAGTAEGTSFCVITIDRENCMIYADCVGVGYDREFEYTTEAVAYTNQLPISTDADGNIYNGIGYKADTYLSGGSEGTKSGIYATGFIPCAIGDTLYCKNVGMQTGLDSHRLAFFDADKNYLTIIKTSATAYSGFTYGDDGNVSKILIKTSSNTGTAFIRLCCSYLGEDSIITVNEEIT